jgi:hypothetical protein
VAINKSRYYKREDGLAVGTGAFVAALGKSQTHIFIFIQQFIIVRKELKGQAHEIGEACSADSLIV